MKQKIHATTIISGYRLASKEACKYINEQLAVPVDSLGKDVLVTAARTSMSSKVIGSDAEFFAQMCVDAINRVKILTKKGKARYPLNSINILKSHGKSMRESIFVPGFALNCTVSSQGFSIFYFIFFHNFLIFCFFLFFYQYRSYEKGNNLF